MLKRFALGACVVVMATATVTAVVGFSALKSVTGALGTHNLLNLGGELTAPKAGKPQTILLVGSDRRQPATGQPGDQGHSDTMVLVRVDPGQPATAMWSLPRDLQVEIPGHGVDKLNAAYHQGGDALTVQTIKQLTGLQINHVIDVNFGGFQQSVDQVGCIYTDVDERYFNDNQDSDHSYSSINIEPGYQKLCGRQALDYVRYRHTDSDIVRQARQQSFLREAQTQLGLGGLLANEPALARILSQQTASDLRGNQDVLALLNEGYAARNRPVHTVGFEGSLGESFVYTSPGQVFDMTQRFLHGARASSPPLPPARAATSSFEQAAAEPKLARSQQAPPSTPPPPTIRTTTGAQQAAAATSQRAGLSIYYPTGLVPGSSFSQPPRVYAITAPNRQQFPSYRMVVSTGEAGSYYGIQGTTWQDPPFLHQPSATKTVAGHSFQVLYGGGGVVAVSWRDRGAVYWVSNTLTQRLTEDQMLAVAASTRPL